MNEFNSGMPYGGYNGTQQPYPYMNGYRAYMPNYGQNGQPTAPQPSPVTPQSTSNIPWIQVPNIETAKNVMISPNQTAYIMNQNAPEFYVKSADSMGVAQMKYYRFTEFSPEEEAKRIETVKSGDFTTREEFTNFAKSVTAEIQALKQAALNATPIPSPVPAPVIEKDQTKKEPEKGTKK